MNAALSVLAGGVGHGREANPAAVEGGSLEAPTDADFFAVLAGLMGAPTPQRAQLAAATPLTSDLEGPGGEGEPAGGADNELVRSGPTAHGRSAPKGEGPALTALSVLQSLAQSGRPVQRAIEAVTAAKVPTVAIATPVTPQALPGDPLAVAIATPVTPQALPGDSLAVAIATPVTPQVLPGDPLAVAIATPITPQVLPGDPLAVAIATPVAPQVLPGDTSAIPSPPTASVGPSSPLGALTLAESDEEALQPPLVGTASAPPAIPDPDLSLIDGDLRDRLLRVIERMRSEYGHTVQVTEGARTPERQRALFAQGRGQPGPVVTWTLESKHLEGTAVDVMVDGSYSNHVGYARLAQIAGEEGLRTLGPKDPGHLELALEASAPTGPPADPFEWPELPARLAEVARPAQLARTTPVAAVSRPARVADRSFPARVIRPLAPGEGNVSAMRFAASTPSEESRARTVNPSSTAATPRETLAALGVRGTDTRQGQDPQRAGFPQAAPQAFEVASEASRLSGMAPARDLGAPAWSNLGGTSPTGAPGDSLLRSAQVREAQDLGAPRSLSEMRLHLDEGTGDEARMAVRVDRGRVSASIGVRDLLSADRLQSRVGELQNSLRLQGLDSGPVRVAAMSGNGLEGFEDRDPSNGRERGNPQGGSQRDSAWGDNSGTRDQTSSRGRSRESRDFFGRERSRRIATGES